MNRKLLSLVFASVLALTACKKDQDAQTEAAVETAASSDLFQYVPADSPYLLGNLDSLPEAVMDGYMDKAGPLLDQLQVQFDTLLKQAQQDSDTDDALVIAWLEELSGKLNRQGLESMGLKLGAKQVIYGIGPFPVWRMEIGDADAIRATVDRVTGKAGIELTTHELDGTEYWLSSGDEDGRAVVAILDDHLVAALLPTTMVQEALPSLLGQQPPAQALDAVDALAKLNRDNGYTPYGSGYVDIGRIVDLFLDGNSPNAQAFRKATDFDATLDAQCVAEIRSITDQFERMEFGVRRMDTQGMDAHFALDLAQGLADELSALTIADSVFGSDPGGAVSMSLGLRIGAFRDWMMNMASARIANPYSCDKLQNLNDQWARMQSQLNSPMPPFIANFTGLRMKLNSIQMMGAMPGNAEGLFAISTSNPQMLIGMGQMFLPDLAQLDLAPGGEPQPLSLSSVPVPVENAYIAMSDDAIGIALGEGEDANLQAFLANHSESNDALLTFGYDFSFYAEKMADLFDSMPVDEEDQDALNLQKEMLRLYSDWLDRQFTTVSLTGKGVEMSQSVSLK